MEVPTPYIRRILDDELDRLTESLPAIAIEGAKGVGKTETALQRARTIIDLDATSQRSIIAGEPGRVTNAAPPVLIDEWQRVPDTWDEVRRAVDRGAKPGHFLLTGSASPSGLGTHSGAARIISLRMRPLTLAERFPGKQTVSLGGLLEGTRPEVSGFSELGLEAYAGEILRSGFPGLRHLPAEALGLQLESYVGRVVDRDFPELGHTLRNPRGLRRWMAAYAAASATTTTFERIRDAATSGQSDKPSRATTIPYRDVLERLWILDPIPGWIPSRNQIARLSASPKHHLVDPALAASLLEVDQDALLAGQDAGPPIPRDGALLGALFESLVTQLVRVLAQSLRAKVGHLRTQGGKHEVDLIVDRGGGRVVAIEVKLGVAVDDNDCRHLNWLKSRLGEDLLDAVVINTGPEAYRRRDGIAVVPAALLGA